MAAAQNHLIELLADRDRLRLLALCEPVDLVLSDVLCERNTALAHVYFPVNGFISLVTQIDSQPQLEVGMIGREGMFGVSVVLGLPLSPVRALVQGAGTAWRISAGRFRRELAGSAALQGLLNRYIGVTLTQLSTSAACLRFHLIGPRLARWLLMSHDRAHTDRFHVTHESLAVMLGVRRVGITVAAGRLQRDGLITYHRGELTVLNRPGLEKAACSCYAAHQWAYTQVMDLVSASVTTTTTTRLPS